MNACNVNMLSYPCPTHYPGEEEGGAALWTLAKLHEGCVEGGLGIEDKGSITATVTHSIL